MKESKTIKITNMGDKTYWYDSATGFQSIVSECVMVSLLSNQLMATITNTKKGTVVYVVVTKYVDDDDI